MTRLDALKDLAAKVEARTARGRYGALCDAAGLDAIDVMRADTAGSLDAAKALHDAVLCRHNPQYGYLVGPQYARIVYPYHGTICDASEHIHPHHVPWTSTKRIMRMILEYAAVIDSCAPLRKDTKRKET